MIDTMGDSLMKVRIQKFIDCSYTQFSGIKICNYMIKNIVMYIISIGMPEES